MSIRTLAGVLFALAVVVTASYLSHQNVDMLSQRFALTPATSVPLYAVLIGIFLLGFLPPAIALLVATLQRGLSERRARRRSRESQSLRGSYRRALDLEADGQWEKAAAELESLSADQPDDFDTLLRYGRLLRQCGRTEEAVEVHKKASVLFPQSVAVLYELASDYRALGDEEVAGQIEDRILRDFAGHGVSVARHRRRSAVDQADWPGARRWQERVDALASDAPRDRDGADAEVLRILAYQEGLERLESGDGAGARELFRPLVEQQPDFLPARIMTGEAFLVDGDGDAALRTWSESYAETSSGVFLQRIEDYFIEREDPLRAIETLHEFASESSDDLLPRFFLGRLYSRLEMHDEALKVLSGLADRIPASPTYHFLLGRLHERRGELGEAVDAYLASLRDAGVAATEFQCGECGERADRWTARCDACGAWSSFDLDFEKQSAALQEPRVTHPTTWGGDDDLLPA